MFSAAAASAVLPFLPMLPGQILLNNLLYDTSPIGDPHRPRRPEQLHAPSALEHRVHPSVHADLRSDQLAVRLPDLRADARKGTARRCTEFRTGWFLESLATQTLIIFAIRTRRIPFFRSRPSVALIASTLTVIAVGVALDTVAPGGGWVSPPCPGSSSPRWPC